MQLAKLYGLLATSILFLTLLTDPTAACTCMPKKPMYGFCSSDLLLKAQVLGAFDELKKFERRYKVKITKVFKGPDTLKRVRYLYTDTHCGYKHPTPVDKDEYFFSVRRHGNRLSTTLCDYHKKWNSLSHEDRKRIENGYYQKKCS